MSSLAQRSLDRWRVFSGEQEPGMRFFGFAAAFFGVWCLYDCLDLLWGGTASAFWLVEGSRKIVGQLKWIQISLAALQGSIVLAAALRRGPRWAWFAALSAVFALRAGEVIFYFELNDFIYYSVTAFILIQFFAAGGDEYVPRWPRQVLRFQTAWIYSATAFLKLNPHWLSGDHLWIRQQYMAQVLRWPYPHWIAGAVARLEVNHWLAIAGAAGEMTLGVLLAFGAPRWVCVSLAVAMHGFAALSLNVWFFGASMVAQVAFVSGSIRSRSSPKTN